MVIIIYKDDQIINRIESTEEYAKEYCEENGYSYAVEELPPIVEKKPSDHEILMTLLGVTE